MVCKMLSTTQQVIIKDNPIQLAQAAAVIFIAEARNSVSKRARFAVAISGGSTPRAMHRMLAEKDHGLNIPWDKMHVFWVDERCVPENDPASNYGAAKKDFLDLVPIPETQVHPIPGRMGPEDGAKKYQREIMNFFHLEDGNFPIFDLIFLGIGADGHTASLFPEQEALYEKEKLVVSVKGGDPYVHRLTMTFPVINRARQIFFLVSGKQKASTVKTIFEDSQVALPAQQIRPVSGKLTWLMDREAASLLSKDIVHE